MPKIVGENMKLSENKQVDIHLLTADELYVPIKTM